MVHAGMKALLKKKTDTHVSINSCYNAVKIVVWHCPWLNKVQTSYDFIGNNKENLNMYISRMHLTFSTIFTAIFPDTSNAFER